MAWHKCNKWTDLTGHSACQCAPVNYDPLVHVRTFAAQCAHCANKLANSCANLSWQPLANYSSFRRNSILRSARTELSPLYSNNASKHCLDHNCDCVSNGFERKRHHQLKSFNELFCSFRCNSALNSALHCSHVRPFTFVVPLTFDYTGNLIIRVVIF